jgi:hypothetical protein
VKVSCSILQAQLCVIILMKKHTKEIIGYRSAGTPNPFCVPEYQRHAYPHGERRKLCARSSTTGCIARFNSAEYHCEPFLERTKKVLQTSVGRPLFLAQARAARAPAAVSALRVPRQTVTWSSLPAPSPSLARPPWPGFHNRQCVQAPAARHVQRAGRIL